VKGGIWRNSGRFFKKWLKGGMVTEGEIVEEWRKEIEGWRRGGAFPLIE